MLLKSQNITTDTWINVVNPTEEEMDKLVAETGVEYDFLKYSLDPEEKARIDQEDEQKLVIINIPTDSFDDYLEYTTIPLGIILLNNCIITICIEETLILDSFKNNYKKDFDILKQTRFLFQIFYQVAQHYLKFLKKLNKQSEEIERQLHRSMRNKELFSLLDLEKSLVYFTTSLKSNESVMDKIIKFNFLVTYDEDKELMDDAMIEIRQAMEMANIYSNILSGMMDAFASVISNNLNIVMKILASITIILAFPTMVASFYGMNVKLPLQEYPFAFPVIFLFSVVISVIVGFIMAKKDMF